MLPLTIKSMLKNEYIGYIVFSFFMAYLAYLMIPYSTMDLTRHYESFEYLSSISFDEVYSYQRIFDYVFNLYMWSISHLGLTQEFVPFTVTFFIYFTYFLIFKKIVDLPSISFPKAITNSLYMLIGLFLVFNEIRFIAVAGSMRNDLAFAIFIYGIINFYLNKNIVTTFILSLVASAIHMAVLPLAIIFFLSNIIQLNRAGRILFIISFILIISGLSGIIFYKIIGFLEPFLRANGLFFHAYMDPDGAWGSGYYQNKNMKTIIVEKFLKPFPFYLAGFYLFFVKKLVLKQAQNYLYMVFIFIAMVSVSRTLLDRYSYFFVLLFIFIFMIELRGKTITSFKKFFIAIFISSMLLMDLSGVVKYRGIFTKSWIKVLYIPAPFMFLYEVREEDYIKRESI